MKIIQAQENHLHIVRQLFNEYKQSVSADGGCQCFAGYEDELASLPGDYAAPTGVIYLAVSDENNITDENVIGCVAIKQRASDSKAAELKRLYVRSEQRSSGSGKKLITAAIEFAKDQQYKSIFLETVASMKAAKSLYSRYGFAPTINPEQAENSSIECYEYLFENDRN